MALLTGPSALDAVLMQMTRTLGEDNRISHIALSKSFSFAEGNEIYTITCRKCKQFERVDDIKLYDSPTLDKLIEVVVSFIKMHYHVAVVPATTGRKFREEPNG